MNGNLNAFEAKVNQHRDANRKANLKGFMSMSFEFEKDILKKANNSLRDKGPIPTYALSCPFSILFDSNVPVYMKEDYTFTYEKGSQIKEEIGDIQNLLSSNTS